MNNEPEIIENETEVERDDKGRFLKGFPADKIQNVGRKGWWELEDGVEKLVKLKMAFSYGATDIEAVAFAELSLDNLYYYQRQNPEFTIEKKSLKSKVLFAARKNVVDRIKFENAKDSDDIEKLAMPASNSWGYMKSHSDEFADRVDPALGKKMGNQIAFVDLSYDPNDTETDTDADGE